MVAVSIDTSVSHFDSLAKNPTESEAMTGRMKVTLYSWTGRVATLVANTTVPLPCERLRTALYQQRLHRLIIVKLEEYA